VSQGADRLLVGAGVLISCALGAMAWLQARPGEPAFMIPVGVASVGYLVAIVRIVGGPDVSRRTLYVCLALALTGRVALLALPEGQGGDSIRYVWDARVQRAGLDPYRARPNDPAFSGLHTDLTRRVHAPWLPTVYPPVAQLYFRVVTSVDESIHAFRVAAVVCDALIAVTLMAVLAAVGRPLAWVLLYAWHPLMPIESAGGAHLDFVGVLALVVSWLALMRGRTAIAAMTFAAAVLVKLLPLMLVPLYWRRIRGRDALLASALAVAATLMVTGGRLPIGSLGAFVDRFRFNSPIFAALEQLAHPRIAAAVAVIVGLAIAAWLRTRRSVQEPDAWGWPMAGALLAAPMICPWYLVWLTPFLWSRWSVPFLAWSLSVLAVYPVWYLRSLGGSWIVPTPLLVIEYGVVAVAMLWLIHQRSRIVSVSSESSAPENAAPLA
jgi:alpha-1,6-mannosyltransferase